MGVTHTGRSGASRIWPQKAFFLLARFNKPVSRPSRNPLAFLPSASSSSVLTIGRLLVLLDRSNGSRMVKADWSSSAGSDPH